jgi:sugar fermentation stimulation protein A
VKGTYTVLLSCKRRTVVRIGKLGIFRLEPGHYLYTGSALGVGAVSLEGRIQRHNRRSKKLRWHIDYLTSNKNCKFVGVVYLVSSRSLECRVNGLIQCSLHAITAFPRFGSSDCSCSSHLLKPCASLSDKEILGKLELVYGRFNPSSQDI